jgi:hypothetical protein
MLTYLKQNWFYTHTNDRQKMMMMRMNWPRVFRLFKQAHQIEIASWTEESEQVQQQAASLSALGAPQLSFQRSQLILLACALFCIQVDNF